MLIRRQYQHETLHAKVELATKFSEGEFILSRPVGGKVNPNHHSRDKVLFKSQLRHPEIVNHVSRAEDKFNWPALRHRNHTMNDIVFGVWISLVQANVV